MVSFRHRFAAGLTRRGYRVAASLDEPDVISALVIGGTRDLPALWRARRRGVRIVQRLNGMNWLHRKRPLGLRHSLRAEYGNWLLNTIRTRLADHIVYQSEFSRRWWERVYGPAPVPSSVVYNAVDLDVYRPGIREQELGTREQGTSPIPNPQSPIPNPATPNPLTPNPLTPNPQSHFRLLLVEGSLAGGYETGLETAVQVTRRLNTRHRTALGRPVELFVVGRVSETLRAAYSGLPDVPLVWGGLVPGERIPEIDRSAHVLYSADINAACPNAVIEALACGLPVAAFDTGALPELVTGDAGRVVPYGGDPWNLDPPDVPALAAAIVEILQNQPRFRSAARARAESAFGLERMVDGYLEALEV